MLARNKLSLLSLVLLAGCSDQAHFLPSNDPAVGIVVVPESSIAQWYYRRQAIDHIKDFQNKDFKDSDIIKEGLVDVDPLSQLIQNNGGGGNYAKGSLAARGIVDNGVPFADSINSHKAKASTDKKEYQIVYRRPPSPTTAPAAPGVAQPSGGVVNSPTPGAGGPGLVPASGTQSPMANPTISNPVPLYPPPMSQQSPPGAMYPTMLK
jgi:hypothetical protein